MGKLLLMKNIAHMLAEGLGENTVQAVRDRHLLQVAPIDYFYVAGERVNVSRAFT